MYETIAETAILCELLRKYPGTRRVFERFGVDYCRDGLSDLKAAAAKAGVPVDVLLLAIAAELDEPLAD